MNPKVVATPSQRDEVSAEGDQDGEVFCPECGYDLQGLDTSRCPECGFAFDPNKLRESQIPWSHRGELGWFKAYWRTAWLATFHTLRLAREISRPVSYRDAQLFRWLTVTHTVGVILILTMWQREWMWEATAMWLYPWSVVVLPPFEQQWFIVLVADGLLFLFLLAGTGVSSYWCHPKWLPAIKQNRAIALNYYCCAPLVLILLGPIVIGTIGIIVNLWEPRFNSDVVWWAATVGLLALGILALYFVGRGIVMRLRFFKQLTQYGAVGMTAFCVLQPILWMALASLILAGIPLIAGYVILVFVSLG